MRAPQSLYNSQIYEKQAEKGCVFRSNLKACKVLDDVTSANFVSANTFSLSLYSVSKVYFSTVSFC